MGGDGGRGRDGGGRFGPPSPATVISLVALFVALSGTALALQRGEVKSKHIAADAVRSKHVADNAIGASAVRAEVTGEADQGASDTGSLDLFKDCDVIGTVTRDVTLTRPARILVFASGFWEDSGANAVEAVVELRSGDSTVATTPRYASELDGQPNTRYDVVAVLRNGSNPEIPPGSYTLRVVLDSVPCQVDDGSSQGGARLGYVTIGAR
jgi:hypothetical protein